MYKCTFMSTDNLYKTFKKDFEYFDQLEDYLMTHNVILIKYLNTALGGEYIA